MLGRYTRTCLVAQSLVVGSGEVELGDCNEPSSGGNRHRGQGRLGTSLAQPRRVRLVGAGAIDQSFAFCLLSSPAGLPAWPFSHAKSCNYHVTMSLFFLDIHVVFAPLLLVSHRVVIASPAQTLPSEKSHQYFAAPLPFDPFHNEARPQ
ncbi:hypothetical protein EJ04DRAFT_3135 [Polyplosphaeria fusca]|uniref:Uncharacterized protein n=1 Tax=Polyplosphaeria fusca TaxID=682080 RepID=A0A9P4RAW9_9PLEO|nr:hypothetical protein EJ04DRAFT_3135 [Polyplosphaeria fusca]